MSFGVYVHWPFCAAKCPYCDFNSHVRAAVPEAEWVDGILRELEWVAANSPRPVVETIFFGGGTPSLMSGAVAGRILQKIAALWPMANDAEITLEANPASADAARFADYRAAGINRVSLGMQALNDADLKVLGRLHDKAEAVAALKLAQVHFDRVSLDLIYARPGQSDAGWRAELKEALRFGTDHLSLYQLTIEPQTPYALLHQQGKLVIPDDDIAAGLFDTTRELTAAAGLPAYEISNHARPGSESRHNLTYWRYGDYVGIGPGAHGRLMTGGAKIATATERKPEGWLSLVEAEGHGMVDQELLEREAQADELLLMGLRLKEGIDLVRWQALSGREPDPDREQFLIEHGFIERLGNSRLRCTPAGMLILDAVVADLAA